MKEGSYFYIRIFFSSISKMKERSGINHDDIRLWVIVPIILLVLLNIVFWFAYVEHQRNTSTINEPKTITLWEYLQSDISMALMASLFIPIFIFLFERKFKISDNYRKNREERNAERIKENREKRLEVIKNTKTMWSHLYELSNEVCFFEKSDNGGLKIRELLKKLNNFSTECDDVMNDLDHRLSNLSKADITTFINFVNYLWKPAFTVATFIEEGVKQDSDIHYLQRSLFITQDTIKNFFYDRLIDILEKSVKLLELIENNPSKQAIEAFTKKPFAESEDIDKEIIELCKKDEKNMLCQLREEIRTKIKQLHSDDKGFFDGLQEWRSTATISKNKDEYVKNYEVARDKLKGVFKTKPDEMPYKSKEWQNFKLAYDSAWEELHKVSMRYYTENEINDFAYTCNFIQEIVKVRRDALINKKIEDSVQKP